MRTLSILGTFSTFGTLGPFDTIPGLRTFVIISRRIYWPDTDPAGIVWFGHFFRYFEEAEEELFRRLGHPRELLLEDLGIWMPRVEVNCLFRSPVRDGDLIDIDVSVREILDRRMTYRFEVRQQADQKLVAEGWYRIAFVARATFESVECPSRIRELVLPLVTAGSG